jgi:biotin carboxylase
MKINTPDELQDAINYAMSWSKTKQAILEEFIEGQEYSGESIAYNGDYKLLVVTEKSTTGAPHFVETGHKQPANLSPEMLKKVEETLYKAFASMGIKYGAVHPEFRITKEGRICFMEIGARMGGDCIGSDLVPISSGYDYMGMVIACGCGKEPSFEKIREPKEARIKYIITKEDLAEFERIKREETEVITRCSDIKELSNNPILKSADRAGYYITAR